jgi:hypothetical protein
MPLSVLRRAYTPEKLCMLYRLLDELSLAATDAVRPAHRVADAHT